MEIWLDPDPIQTNGNLDLALLFQVRNLLSCSGTWSSMLKANLLTVGICKHCEIGSLPTHVAGKLEEH